MDIKKLIGVTLGTCTLERVIGRGGMGAVYLAQQSRPVRTVAVKVLIPSDAFDSEEQRVFLERFRREADTVAKLEHKNILSIYEYDEASVDGQQLAYLVMPFIRGGTLRERIDDMKRSGTHFDLKLVASYISQVADALSYAHSLGVVHRDIKPGNLLFHQDGRLLLSDFGIVHLKAMPSLTNVGSFLGTAEYASPEQISTSEVDFRSDIYSLGIILYELLTGTVPHTGSSPFEVMARKLNEPVPSVRDSRPDLSPGVEAVVMKALARNPADRYQTASMLAADLRASVASMPEAALRLGGDANNTDPTVSGPPWGAPAPTTPISGAGNAFAPAQPGSSVPAGGAPWQRPPGQWQWPSQAQAQSQGPVGVLPTGAASAPLVASEPGKSSPNGQAAAIGPNARTYQQSRRLFFYGIALITLLSQFLVFILLNAKGKGTAETLAMTAMLGVLLGSGINLLALAATGFTGVSRRRSIRRFVYRSLVNALVLPVICGYIINFGGLSDAVHHLAAYILLLLSNLYALRQLALVDKAREQIEVAPVRWRQAAMGALTGLLPLTIILVFALAAPFSYVHYLPPLLNLFGMLLVVFIGTPTAGAVMSVRLSENMRFPGLLRSSAIAGILMFAGASALVVIWGLLFPNHSQFLYNLRETWVTLLCIMSVLAVLGALRGMLDAWIYQQIRNRNSGH